MEIIYECSYSYFFIFVGFPILYYQLAVRTWLIKNVGEKIILAIVVFVSHMIIVALSNVYIPLLDSLGYYLTRHTYVGWIVLGCVHSIVSWMLISFLAGKIF
jgi:hypothetical protein